MTDSDYSVEWVNPTTMLCCVIGERLSVAQRHQCLLMIHQAILDSHKQLLVNIVPGFNEILLYFDPNKIDYAYHVTLISRLVKTHLKPYTHSPDYFGAAHNALDSQEVDISTRPITAIEVNFDVHGQYDLQHIATHLGLTRQALITQFCAIDFTVILNGFMPGFVYLSGLPACLHIPRLATPRVKVPKGAVAIAEAYCGIYPQQSPGGWHIIGVTEHKMFDIKQTPPASCVTGERIQFRATHNA